MGPLAGFKIIEIKGIGPGPYAGMLLADMGAEVIVVERSSKPSGIALPTAHDCNSRGKKSIALNLKTEQGLAVLMSLLKDADGMFEGFRPGVAEKLGFGPDQCLALNPKLVYGRITGWGQTGPLAQAAGHDINYIAITGALAAIGSKQKPEAPLNLVGDYAGGSMFLVIGMLAAMLEAQRTGIGQVIDAAITDGSASLMSIFHSMSALGQWRAQRQSNLLDGAAHFYDVYETADGKFISIGSIEPQFYAELMRLAELEVDEFAPQMNAAMWPVLKAKLIAVFKTKTRQAWCDLMEGTDVCFAPVLDYDEAPQHPHNQARESYIELNGLVQPAPAPKFSRTVCDKPSAPVAEGASSEVILKAHGYDEAAIAQMRENGVLS